MKKPVYKLLDEKGRVLIPLEMRQKAEIEKGDILKVSINTGKIVISKVDILEVGKQDAEAVIVLLPGTMLASTRGQMRASAPTKQLQK